MRKLMPVLLILSGLAAGTGAGVFLRPAPAPDLEAEAGGGPPEPAPKKEPQTPEYVKLNNQFVIPVVDAGEVRALVILSLSLETEAGLGPEIHAREPKLRDAFLRVLFDHANAGGFHGAFTESANVTRLRMALREVAQKTIGPAVSDVLIIDMIRQDN